MPGSAEALPSNFGAAYGSATLFASKPTIPQAGMTHALVGNVIADAGGEPAIEEACAGLAGGQRPVLAALARLLQRHAMQTLGLARPEAEDPGPGVVGTAVQDRHGVAVEAEDHGLAELVGGCKPDPDRKDRASPHHLGRDRRRRSGSACGRGRSSCRDETSSDSDKSR